MKNIKKIAFLFLSVCSLLFVACDEKGDFLTGGSKTGGLLNVKKEAITYVVGNGLTKPYDNQITIFQGVEKVVKIDIYKSFTTTKVVNGVKVTFTSNQILLKSITLLANVQTESVSYSTTYNDLIAGLVIDGAPLPAADSSLQIGDYFTLVYKSTLNTGLIHENSVKTKLSVGTRFAGTYRVIQGDYWRIGTPRPDISWVGETRIIESVDATTYRFVGYCGYFGPSNGSADNTHYFTVDANDVVRTPVTYNGLAQILNALPVINCEETPTNMTNACANTPNNTIVRDDVNGRDKIYRSYGYLNTTGPREFYEVLEKIVD